MSTFLLHQKIFPLGVLCSPKALKRNSSIPHPSFTRDLVVFLVVANIPRVLLSNNTNSLRYRNNTPPMASNRCRRNRQLRLLPCLPCRSQKAGNRASTSNLPNNTTSSHRSNTSSGRHNNMSSSRRNNIRRSNTLRTLLSRRKLHQLQIHTVLLLRRVGHRACTVNGSTTLTNHSRPQLLPLSRLNKHSRQPRLTTPTLPNNSNSNSNRSKVFRLLLRPRHRRGRKTPLRRYLRPPYFRLGQLMSAGGSTMVRYTTTKSLRSAIPRRLHLWRLAGPRKSRAGTSMSNKGMFRLYTRQCLAMLNAQGAW